MLVRIRLCDAHNEGSRIDFSGVFGVVVSLKTHVFSVNTAHF